MDYRVLDEALAYLNGDSYEDGYVYESLQDEFNLDLMLLEAEQELFSEIQLESADIEILNEGIRETIMQYVQKVIQGIQKAWNKFANAFTQAELNHLKNQVKPVIDKSENIDFTINNYKEIDLEKMVNIKIEPFDYDRMKENLDSAEDFYRTFYPNLDVTNSKNVKEALEKFLGKKIVDKYRCTEKELSEIYDFAAVKYFEYRNLIQKDIDNLNQASENIKNTVNQVTASETPVTNESFDWFLTDTLLEADTPGGNANGDAKTSFTDNSGETTKTDGSEQTKQENENRKKATKAVSTYMSCTTKLLSAKMSILNKQKREAFLILNHFYASKKVNNTAVAAKNKANEIRTDVAAKVDTRLRKK
jgi:hypothetical protein